MFENVVVATDGSGNADRAVAVAANLASAFGAKLTIVHVAATYLSLERAEATPDLPPEVRDDIKKIHDTLGGLETSPYAPVPAPQSAIAYIGNSVLERAEGVARENGAKDVSRVLAYGDSVEKIVAEAEKAGAGLIVLGTRGLSDLGGLVMGSVSHKVIYLAQCPCVTVK